MDLFSYDHFLQHIVFAVDLLHNMMTIRSAIPANANFIATAISTYILHQLANTNGGNKKNNNENEGRKITMAEQQIVNLYTMLPSMD